MERECEGEKEDEDGVIASFIVFFFFFFFFQLINQINLAVSFSLLETEASVFLSIAMLHASKDHWPAKGRKRCHALLFLSSHKTNMWLYKGLLVCLH